MQKFNVAVVGNAKTIKKSEKSKIAFNVGKLLVDNGFSVITGGMGGVMKYASKGAKSSKKYRYGKTIGILPNRDREDVNKYIDIPIYTGLGLVRNTILVTTADAIISIGGGSGTLNEISTAWQMNKLIISIKSDGWSEALRGRSLDSRRDDSIFSADTPKEAIKVLKREVKSYSKKRFIGVQR